MRERATPLKKKLAVVLITLIAIGALVSNSRYQEYPDFAPATIAMNNHLSKLRQEWRNVTVSKQSNLIFATSVDVLLSRPIYKSDSRVNKELRTYLLFMGTAIHLPWERRTAYDHSLEIRDFYDSLLERR